MPQERLWWKNSVFYNVYVRSFKDANGDGIGDIEGLIEKLDYLRYTLGIDAIWVAGILKSPWKDFGYDVSGYQEIEPVFGDLTGYRKLIAEAHRRELKVIADFIPNHCSDQHPWFAESRSSRDNPKRDWFMWKDAKQDGSPPNNWLSVFGGSAWEWDELTGQYYLHSFLKEQPDLNLRNPETRRAIFDVARFWLDLGVDGLRIDVANHAIKDPAFRDNPPLPVQLDNPYKPMGEYDSQMHLYDREYGPDIYEFWKEFRVELDSYGAEQPRAAFGEAHVFDWPTWAKYYGDSNNGLNMPFNLGFIGASWDVASFRGIVDGIEAALPEGAWPNYMFNNFDESRAASRYGYEKARVAAMMLLTLRGTPMLCYGEELGLPNVEVAEELVQDPWGKRVPGLGRDPFRTPMQWNGQKHAGFSDPSTPCLWLPVMPDCTEHNVETQLAKPDSILNLYRKLLQLRKQESALKCGGYKPVEEAPDGVFCYDRQADGELLRIVLNLQGEDKEMNSFSLRGSILLSTHMDRNDEEISDRWKLRADEGVMIRMNRS